MERSYDDECGFSSQSIIAAAITAAELAEVLHSPDTDDSEHWALHARCSNGFGEACVLPDD